MAAVGYVLFPDAREGEGPMSGVNAAIRDLSNVSGAQYHAPFHPVRMSGPRAWHSFGAAIEPEEMLRILRARDWVWPALVVYRTSEDNRWNFVTLGLGFALRGGEEL